MTSRQLSHNSKPVRPVRTSEITMNKNQQRQRDDLDTEDFLNSFFENHPEIEQVEEEE